MSWQGAREVCDQTYLCDRSKLPYNQTTSTRYLLLKEHFTYVFQPVSGGTELYVLFIWNKGELACSRRLLFFLYFISPGFSVVLGILLPSN